MLLPSLLKTGGNPAVAQKQRGIAFVQRFCLLGHLNFSLFDGETLLATQCSIVTLVQRLRLLREHTVELPRSNEAISRWRRNVQRSRW
jgi:hypothetical protein